MTEQKCRKCGEMVESEDLGKPADCFYCECGNSWCDIYSYADRMADYADCLRKAKKEGG